MEDELEVSTEVSADSEEVVDDTSTEVGVEDTTFVDPDDADPWEALKAKGYDPTKLEKSFTRFTTELESVKAQRAKDEAEMAPYRQIQEAFKDERVLKAFEAALDADESDVSDVEVLRTKVSNMERDRAIEREVDSLKAYVASNEGFPEVDEREVLAYAQNNKIGNLKSAYNDLHFEAIRESARESAFNEVKSGRKAKAVTQAVSTAKAVPAFTEDEIASMSAEEFADKRPQILAHYAAKRGK